MIVDSNPGMTTSISALLDISGEYMMCACCGYMWARADVVLCVCPLRRADGYGSVWVELYRLDSDETVENSDEATDALGALFGSRTFEIVDRDQETMDWRVVLPVKVLRQLEMTGYLSYEDDSYRAEIAA